MRGGGGPQPGLPDPCCHQPGLPSQAGLPARRSGRAGRGLCLKAARPPEDPGVGAGRAEPPSPRVPPKRTTLTFWKTRPSSGGCREGRPPGLSIVNTHRQRRHAQSRTRICMHTCAHTRTHPAPTQPEGSSPGRLLQDVWLSQASGGWSLLGHPLPLTLPGSPAAAFQGPSPTRLCWWSGLLPRQPTS